MTTDIQDQLNRIERKLDSLIMNDAPKNKTGWPVYVPTIEDELSAAVVRHGNKPWLHFEEKARKYRKGKK